MIASIVFILNLTIPNQIVETKMNQARDAVGNSDIVVASYESFYINDIKTNDEKTNYVGVNDLYVIHKNKTLVIYGTNVTKASSFILFTLIRLTSDALVTLVPYITNVLFLCITYKSFTPT